MKKVVRILLAILMVMCVALSVTACKSECEKGNHTWDEGTVTKEATCAATGVKTFKCTLCDNGEKTEVIPKTTNHKPIDASVPATCTKAGTTGATKCDVCGVAIAAGTVVSALDHSVTTWTPSKTNENKHEGVCTRPNCGETVIADHKPNTDGTACKDCGKELGTVNPPHNHDYEGQPWQVDISSGKHYQSCKDTDCVVRNEHAALMGKYAATDGKHSHSCTVQGCTVSEEHDPAFGDYITSDINKHYKECSKCDITTDEGNHDHSILNKINDSQHSVACSVCGKAFENADHVWVINESKGHAATCENEGARVYDCACGAEKSEPVAKIPHTIEFVSTAATHRSYCTVCGETIIAETEHDKVDGELVWNNTDKDEHYRWCKTCKYIDETTRGAHNYGDGKLTCTVCERTPEDVIVATFYKGEYTRFDTLVDAVKSITDGDEAVIYLGRDLEGEGIFIPSSRNINFRLQGNTYTVVSGAVGSVNYESQAFHIEKNSNITIQNGTITSKAGSGVKMLVQNYANLTLMNNLTLDGSNLDADGNNRLYTLSNNFGEISIRNTTIVAKTEKDVAFDVWYSAAYAGGVKVILGENNTISGIIEYGSAVADTDWSKVSLVMLTDRNRSIVFSSSLTCEQANITYADGTKVLTHMLSEGWSYENERHFHECSRCHIHADEAACTKETIEGKKETCTENGWTEGVRCSVCETTIVEPEQILAHHEFADTLTAIDAIQHGYKCANCDEYNKAASHAYKANHCEACGKEITQDEIIELMSSLSMGSYLLGNGDNTFTLTGYYGGKIRNYNYALNDVSGNLLIACFDRELDLTKENLVIGDEIAVTGRILNYGGDIEFEGFTYELVRRGESSITVEIVDSEGNASDKAVVTFAPALTGGKAENLSAVRFTVAVTDGWIINLMSADNNVDITWDAENEQFFFVVKGDTVVTVEVKEDDGKQEYSKEETLITNNTNPICETDKVMQVGAVGFKFDNNGASNPVNWNNATYVRLQAGNRITITLPEGYTLLTITVVHSDTTYNKGANYTVDGIKGQFKTNDVNAVWTNSVKGKNSVEIVNDASSQARIKSITVSYLVAIECTTKHANVVEIAQATDATCDEQGYKAAGVYCKDCGHFFTDNMTKLADEQIIPAKGHDYVAVDATVSDCQTKAVAAHYSCKGCDKLFVETDGQKTETTLEAITGEFGAHSYGDWTHVADTTTHSRDCSVCGNVVTEPCKAADDAEWQADDINHWKVCAVCADGKVELGAHNSETHCTICDKDIVAYGSISYKVFDGETFEEIDINSIKIDLPEKAAIGGKVAFTVSSDAYTISMVEWSEDVNAGATDGETLNEPYTFTAAATNLIIVTVEAKATYTVAYTNPENGTISITRKDGEDIKWTHSDTNPSEATLYEGTELIINVIGEGTVTIEYTLGAEAKTVNGNTAEVALTANLTVTATLILVTEKDISIMGADLLKSITNNSYSNKTYTGDSFGAENELKSLVINASKQTSTITDLPVTKTKSITIEACEGKSITYLRLEFKQWGTKALGTITIKITTNGAEKTIMGNSDFEQTFDLSSYENVTKIVVSSNQTTNQAGIAQIDLKVK